MNELQKRIVFTGALVVLAAAAASAGVVLYRMLNAPPSGATIVADPAPTAAVAGTGTGAAAALSPGDRRPQFQLHDLDGRLRSVSEWDGKLLFVNFWATWCPPCLEEIPEFIRLQAKHEASGVQFLGVALDSAENVRSFGAEHGLNYPSLHGGADAIETSKAYGNEVGALPYTVVVGRDGRVLLTHHGVLDAAQAEALIAAH